ASAPPGSPPAHRPPIRMPSRKRRPRYSATLPSIRSTIPMPTPKISSRRTPAMPCFYLRTARCAQYATELFSPSSRRWQPETGEKSLARTASNPWSQRRLQWAWLAIALALLLTGCNSHKQPAYQNQQGFHFTPPPGWVERARDDALPGKSGQRQPDLP